MVEKNSPAGGEEGLIDDEREGGKPCKAESAFVEDTGG